jgi:hypothetical protein
LQRRNKVTGRRWRQALLPASCFLLALLALLLLLLLHQRAHLDHEGGELVHSPVLPLNVILV